MTTDPKQAGDRVLSGLRNICLPQVRGAHDSDLLLHRGKAYIAYMANDHQLGEAPDWPYVYNVLTVIDISTGRIEKSETFAASQMRYDNQTLPSGACFVPRIVKKDDRTLRCIFASEEPGRRQSQTWWIDYDLQTGVFARTIHPMELETSQGVFPMQPIHLYNHAAAEGFVGNRPTHGLYIHGSHKIFHGRPHAVLTNFPEGPLALASLNDELTRFTILGTFFRPLNAWLNEAAVNRMPDGRLLAISREEKSGNYMFTTSPDGRTWSDHEYRDIVPNGTSSKPLLDCFGGTYYLGWNEATRINGVHRSVFNLDTSRDGRQWTRRFRFESEASFQYPCLAEYDGTIYLAVTQGERCDDHRSGKGRIMFGELEKVPTT